MKIFHKITDWVGIRPIHIVFKSRKAAGEILGKNLLSVVKNTISYDLLSKGNSIIVIGIANGGIVVAKEIAEKFGCELAVIAPVRISDEIDVENTLGAVLHIRHPCTVVDLIKDRNGDTFYMIAKEKTELSLDQSYREDLFKRALQKSNAYADYESNSITGKIVILADDGVFSGLTALLSLSWIMHQNPSYLMFASPVAPNEFYESVNNNEKIMVDHMEILENIFPSSNRNSVSEYYKQFEQIDEKRVKQLLDNYHCNRSY